MILDNMCIDFVLILYNCILVDFLLLFSFCFFEHSKYVKLPSTQSESTLK